MSDASRSPDGLPPGWSRREFLSRAGGFAGLAATGVVGADLLAACANAGTKSNTGSSVKPVRGGHVIENGGPQTQGFNPVLNPYNDVPGRYIFDGLIANDGVGNLFPLLAESMPKVNPDATSFTFTLRKNMKWTDGQPLTAEDVVFTYSLMLDAQYKDVKSPYRADMVQFVDTITSPDPNTVVFKLKSPWVPFLAKHGWHGIVPKHVLGGMTAAQINTADFNLKPTVSSGPFKFVDAVIGDHATLARNDAYYRGSPYLDSYVFQNAGSEANFVNLMKTGTMDCGRVIGPTNVPELKAQPSIDVISYPANGLTNYWYQLDPAKGAGRIFQSKAVRQALIYGLDRQGMVDGIYAKIGGVVPTSVFPTISWAYNPNVKTRYSFDTSKAASMLDADGWTRTSGGVRMKAGQPLKFEITAPTDSKEYTNIAQAMQEAWKNLGCDVSVKMVTYAQLVNIAYYTRAFDVIIPGLGFNVDPDPSAFFHSRNITAGGTNAGSYKNAQLDSLLDQAVSTSDQSKRKSLYFQIQDIIWDDAPTVGLVLTTGFFAYNKRVRGLAEGIGTFTNLGPRSFVKDTFVTS